MSDQLPFTQIIGSGRYLPERILTNADLEKMVETTDEWIQSRTGIKQRHITAEGETTCDMAEQAAKQALQDANVEAKDLDLVLVATTTPDQVFPNMGCLLQQRIGAKQCIAFSLEAACSGFLYGISVADKFIKTGDVKTALVVGAEKLSAIVDWKDRSTCVLFGDGAGAVVLKRGAKPGVLSSHLCADGEHKDLLYFPYGVGKSFDKIRDADAHVHMQGNEVFKVAVRSFITSVKKTLASNDMSAEDVDWFIPHQANIRIITAVADRLKFPMEKVIETVSIHGNTSTASVPMALDVARRDGRIKAGDKVLLAAFGGGFTWGSMLVVI